MKSLYDFLGKYKGKKMLLIFPHPDDEAYVAGGLLQLCQNLSIETKLICLTKGGRGLIPHDPDDQRKLKAIRQSELKRSSRILGVDELVLWDYPDAKLNNEKNLWMPKLKREIDNSCASIIVTFDLSGITGHPDHLIINSVVFRLVKEMLKKPVLLWRVPDMQELSYFKENKAIKFAQKPTHVLNYSLAVSLKKIRAIFTHKSQLKNLTFKLQILEWFLFDQKELYHLVNFKNSYRSKIIFKDI